MPKFIIILFSLFISQSIEAKIKFEILDKFNNSNTQFTELKSKAVEKIKSLKSKAIDKIKKLKSKTMNKVNNGTKNHDIYEGNIVFPSQDELEDFIDNVLSEMYTNDEIKDKFIQISGPILNILQSLMTNKMSSITIKSTVKAATKDLEDIGINVSVVRKLNIHNFFVLFTIPSQFKLKLIVKASKNTLKTSLVFEHINGQKKQYFYDGPTNTFKQEKI